MDPPSRPGGLQHLRIDFPPKLSVTDPLRPMNAPSFSLSRIALGLLLAGLSAGVGCDTGSKSAVHAPPPAPTVKTVVVQAPSVPAALAQRPATPPVPTPPPSAAPPAAAIQPAPPSPAAVPAAPVLPNAPVDPSGTVAVPVPPPLPGPVADVVELARGGVDEGVITEYIANIRQPFAFGASQIVYLNDLGVSSNVLHGLMRQSALLRPDGAAAAGQATIGTTATTLPPAATSQPVTAIPQAVPEAQAPATTVQGTAPPPPGSATTTVVAPAASPTVVNQQVFYQALAPYGSWVQVPAYGWCWQPTVAVVNTTWQPYCDGGSWLWTDAGWYWNSSYSWGWAPFHYGRWHHNARVGWVWHPGYDWAPAWVAWRSSPAHCGWAPLPPECRWNASVGFSWFNGNTAVSVGFGIGATAWYATTWDRFCDPHLYHHRLPRQRVERFVQESNLQVAGGNGVNIRGDNNTVIINNGITREEVQRHTRDEIRRTALRDVASPAAAQGPAVGAAASGGRPNPTGGGRPTEVAVYRPKVPVHDAQPPETVLRRQELTRPAPLRAPSPSGPASSAGGIGIDPSANRPLPVPALGGSLNPNRPAPPKAAGSGPASSLVPPTGPSTIPNRPAPVTGGGVPMERATRTVTPPARPQIGVPGGLPPASAPRFTGNPSPASPTPPSTQGLSPSRPPETRIPPPGLGNGFAPAPGGSIPARPGSIPDRSPVPTPAQPPASRPLPTPVTALPTASVPSTREAGAPRPTPEAFAAPPARTVVVPGTGVSSRPAAAGTPPAARVPAVPTPSRQEAFRPGPAQVPAPTAALPLPPAGAAPSRPVPQAFPQPARVAPSFPSAPPAAVAPSPRPAPAPAVSLPPAAVQSRPMTIQPAPAPAFNPAPRPAPTPVPVQAVPSFPAPQPAIRPAPAPAPSGPPPSSAPAPSGRPGPRRAVDP